MRRLAGSRVKPSLVSSGRCSSRLAAIPAACLWAVWGIAAAVVMVAAAGGLRLDDVASPPTRDACGARGGRALARRSCGARHQRRLRDVLAAADRAALEPSARVRRRSRGWLTGEQPTPDGRRVGHAGLELTGWRLAGGAHLYPKLWPLGWGSEPLVALRHGRRSRRGRRAPPVYDRPFALRVGDPRESQRWVPSRP